MKRYFVAEGYMGYVNGEYKYTLRKISDYGERYPNILFCVEVIKRIIITMTEYSPVPPLSRNAGAGYTSTMRHCVVTLWPLKKKKKKCFDWQ